MNFNSLHIHWKILIIIGAITVFILTLLLIVTFIYFESATKVETNEFNDFFEEFKKDIVDYPNLPKIKELSSDNYLRNLFDINITDKYDETLIMI